MDTSVRSLDGVWHLVWTKSDINAEFLVRRLFADRAFQLVYNSLQAQESFQYFTDVTKYTGWPKKVSHYQMIKKSY